MPFPITCLIFRRGTVNLTEVAYVNSWFTQRWLTCVHFKYTQLLSMYQYLCPICSMAFKDPTCRSTYKVSLGVKKCMFFKVIATCLKIVLFDLTRCCIWLEDAWYVAGTFFATCVFLPENVYQPVWDGACEWTSTYLCVGKNTLPDLNKEIYFQDSVCFWACSC